MKVDIIEGGTESAILYSKMSRAMFIDIYDAEFMKSGFGISILGTNADGRSVTIPVETPLKEPTVPAPPLLPTTVPSENLLENGK